jgi:hypothetical protein
MKEVKWLVVFFGSMLFFSLIGCSINIFIDPFGAFGDKLLNWYDYNITKNTRVAKIEYLEKYHNNYDSYIIGGSKSGTLDLNILNKRKNAKFYNAYVSTGDTYDYEQFLYYIVDNYETKNIILHISSHEMAEYGKFKNETKYGLYKMSNVKISNQSSLKYYYKYLTADFQYSFFKLDSLVQKEMLDINPMLKADTGGLRKESVSIYELGSIEEYEEIHPKFVNQTLKKVSGECIDETISGIDRMKSYCDKNDVDFMIIVGPTYKKELDRYDLNELAYFWEELASISEYWNFAGYSGVSYDPRYFFDNLHYSTYTGNLILDKIFSFENSEIPDNFGEYVTDDNVNDYINSVIPSDELN